MRANDDIKNKLLLKRMEFWRIRARHGPIGNCSKGRGRKNYLYLVRKYPALAAQHGFRGVDAY
jgi:hypothetical protein